MSRNVLLGISISWILLSVQVSARGAEDPVGWALLRNRTPEKVEIHVVPAGKKPFDFLLAPGQSLRLTDALEYRITLGVSPKAWSLDASPPEDEKSDDDNFDMADFEGARPVRHPLGPWQLRHYQIAEQNGIKTVQSGIGVEDQKSFAREYRETMEELGLDWRHLPTVPGYLDFEESPTHDVRKSEALEAAYRSIVEETIEKLLEKHLEATPRSWNGVRMISGTGSEDVQPGSGSPKNEKVRIAFQFRAPGGLSKEVRDFCQSSIAQALGVGSDEVRLLTKVPAPSAANAPLRAEFVGPKGQPLIEKVRGAVLNRLQELGVRIQLPVEGRENELIFVSEWKHGATAVPDAFANASIRSRLRTKCVFRPSQTYDGYVIPASCDIACQAEIETKARSADARKFRPLASYRGFSALHATTEGDPGGNAGKKGEPTIEQQVVNLEDALTRLLSKNHDAEEGDAANNLEETLEELVRARPQPIERNARRVNQRTLGVKFHICKEGVHIDSAIAGSPATRCTDKETGENIQLEGNDHILAIDGVEMRTEEQFLQSISAGTGAIILTVKDSRTGKTRRLAVDFD